MPIIIEQTRINWDFWRNAGWSIADLFHQGPGDGHQVAGGEGGVEAEVGGEGGEDELLQPPVGAHIAGGGELVAFAYICLTLLLILIIRDHKGT